MEVVLAVIIAFVLYRIFTFKDRHAEFLAKLKPCETHKWEYRKQPESDDEYMICKNCEKTPTQIVEGL